MSIIPKISKSDFKTFHGRAKNLYSLRTKENKITNYVPNEAQLILNQVREEQFSKSISMKGVPQAKIILLKSRQVGGTTDTAMFNFDTMLNLDHAFATIIAHDDKSTSIIYDKYKHIFNYLPDYVQITEDDGTEIVDSQGNPLMIEIKPEKESYSGHRLQFADKTKSRLVIRTAGSGDNVGRGDTMNAIHLCIHKDGLVILSDGSTKSIKNIEIGDSIITSSGKIAKVSNKWYIGKKDTINIETWLTDSKLPVTKQHKILTLDGYKQAGEITKDDYIQLPSIKFTNELKEYTIDLNDYSRWSTSKNVTNHTFKFDYDFGYLCGYYLAEGHIKLHKGKPNKVQFTHHTEEHYVDKIIEDYGFLGGVDSIKRENSLTHKTTFYSSLLARTLNELFGRVETKRIPDWIFKTNKRFAEGLVIGYLCGDGSKTQSTWKRKNTKQKNSSKISHEIIYDSLKRIESGESLHVLAKELGFTYNGIKRWVTHYSNKTLEELKEIRTPQEEIKTNFIVSSCIHERITRQLRRIIIGLNIGVPSVKKYKRKRYDKPTKDIYQLLLSGQIAKYFSPLIDGCESSGNLQSYSNKYKQVDGKWYVKVKSVEDFEYNDVYDIEVNHSDHNFETPIGIVSNSEGAFYTHFDEVLNSVNQTLPLNGYVYSVIESTANGVSGIGKGFYDLWSKSEQEWKRYVNGHISSFEGYRPVFIPWYYMSEYRIPLMGGKLIDIEAINFGSPENRQKFLDMEEYLIEEVFDDKEEGLKAINWYRWCVKDNCGYNYRKAQQEYPTTAEEAFLSTDNSFFDAVKLFEVKQTYEQKGEPEHKTGYINEDFEFEESSIGDLKVWKEADPAYTNRYVVSLDPSYGVEGGDFSCMFVYDRLEDEFVAKWYGNMKEDLVAEELLKLAYYYNNALIVPEMNLNTVITLIRPDGIMPYTGDIYMREVKARGTVEYGYHTLGNTRKILIDKYNSWLRNNYFNIKDLDSLDEHLSFIKRVRNNVPKYEAAEGKHDDQVIAGALCIVGSEWWEEEIGHLTEDRTDYQNIIEPKGKGRILKNSSFGNHLARNASRKTTFKQSSIGS